MQGFEVMKEIGGYFGFEKLISKEYYSDLIPLNTARNALAYLIKSRKIKKLYIPYFLCDSVFNVCKREKCDYEYYHIDENFMPVFDKELGEYEYLYVVNYYGRVSNEKVEVIKKQYANIIFDNVQAFFQKPVKDIDTIYSCRKFFGVPDGAYLSTNTKLDDIKIDISKDRMKHILGRFEGTASDYYSDFKSNDHSFAELELRYMSELTHNILGAIDYRNVMKKRDENYAYLANKLDNINSLKSVHPNGPYMYPFYCENGMEVKKKLAEKKVFVATLWPNVLDTVESGMLEYNYSANILPLPCDQRYDENDMSYIIKTLFEILSEIKGK